MAVTLIDYPVPVQDPEGRFLPKWELTFGDTRRPNWFLTLVLADEQGRFRCIETRFHGEGAKDEFSPKWAARFPVTRCIREARLACQQVIEEGEDLDAGGLPFGYPNRANRRRWYPALLATIERWEQLGMSPMDAYREVARRKRIDVNRVKQWVYVGRQVAAEEKDGKPRRKR